RPRWTTSRSSCDPMGSSSCSAPAGWRCRSSNALLPGPVSQRCLEMANVFYEKDADPALIASRKVAILGYGSQGHAHALNLKDSGVDVRVGLRAGSSSQAKAEAAGLRVVPIDQAAAEADLIMILLPDTEQRDVYESAIAPHLNGGDALFFAHGFNIRYEQINP